VLIAVFALPASAAARTKTVYAGEPPSADKVLQKYGGSVNAFFLNRVTIHTGDSIKFLNNGFHTVDLPDRSGQDLPLILRHETVEGVTDAAGQPFWFNGKFPSASLNPAVVIPKLAPTYDGTQRIVDPVPLGSGKPKPMVVQFTKAGTYKYFCDIHAGMAGFVVVKPASTPIPSARQDARALAAQVAAAEKTAKQVVKTHVAKNTVSLGVTGPGGVEDFAMFPSRLVVPTGAVVNFTMSKFSREIHTASFGPGKYLNAIANSIQGPAPQQQAIFPSDNPAAGPPIVSPTIHGNGFANTGFLDSDPGSKTIPVAGKLKFTTPGVYHYICLIHPFMRGTVIVQQ
jgi:plastocyanin